MLVKIFKSEIISSQANPMLLFAMSVRTELKIIESASDSTNTFPHIRHPRSANSE